MSAVVAARVEADPTDLLTGERVSTGPVVTVKIDNTPAARPQLGLDDADHVWVQEVEAGITRLLAVFHTRLPDHVGPVRSARSTDVELLYGSPLLVYSGANGDVSRQLDRSGLPTASGGTGLRRVAGRSAPYDLMADLPSLAGRRRLARPGVPGLQFAADDPDWASAKKAGATTVMVGSGRQRFTCRRSLPRRSQRHHHRQRGGCRSRTSPTATPTSTGPGR